MEPKHVIFSLAVLNLVFLAIFIFLTRTTIFDSWMLNKILPKLCLQQEADGSRVFAFCEEEISVPPAE